MTMKNLHLTVSVAGVCLLVLCLTTSSHARGFGGFHGGGLGGAGLAGAGMRGGMGALGGMGSLGGMRSMVGPGAGANLAGLARGGLPNAFPRGAMPGGLNLEAMQNRLPAMAGAGRGGLPGGLNPGALAERAAGINAGGLSGLNRPSTNSPLANRIPNAGQLSNFLHIPSDKGLNHLSGETQSRASQLYDKAKAGNNPFDNRISGETQSKLSQLYDAAKSGKRPGDFISGETQKPLSRLYDNVKAGDGPFKNFIPGETQKPLSRLYDQIRANGLHPLHPWSPWRIHNNAIIIRRNFNAYFIFTPGWYARYPAAWYPAAWYYGDPWIWAPWGTLAPWCGFPAQPVFYDYGDNVVYNQNSVVVNGNPAGTPEQYAEQAQDLAEQGSQDSAADDDKEWMSLGVFAVSMEDQKTASMMMQLAINQAGVIRGNYTNLTTKDTQVIHGQVDKKSLRAAWTIGDKDNIVLDTGIYNLTEDQTSVLVHFGKEKTEQWLMVRVQQKDSTDPSAKADADK